MRFLRRVRRFQAGAQPGAAGRVPGEAETRSEMEGDGPLETEGGAPKPTPWQSPEAPITAGVTAVAPPPRQRRRSAFWRVAGIALAGAVVGGAAVYVGVPAYRVRAAGFPQIATVPVTADQQSAGAPAVAVYKALSPSVVLVQNQSTVNSFYGPQSQTAWGSGVIFSPDGYIVTNDHVVAGEASVTVTLKDGTSFPAKVVGGDPSTDLAVIKINAGHALAAATFADSADVSPGELAIAIGNPLGPTFAQSVTTGVVGAIRPMLYGLDSASPRVTEMIQTDAPINPGNSGGALANAQGEVIGITSIKVAGTGEQGVAATGLGFAVPSNAVKAVVNDLVQYGYVKRAWLGVEIGGASTNSTTTPATLTISGVTSGGPAAGRLQPGDVIATWQGQKVVNYYDLVGDINAVQPGQAVTIGVQRGGTIHNVSITLGAEPKSMVDAQQQPQPSGPVIPFPSPFPFPGQ